MNSRIGFVGVGEVDAHTALGAQAVEGVQETPQLELMPADHAGRNVMATCNGGIWTPWRIELVVVRCKDMAHRSASESDYGDSRCIKRRSFYLRKSSCLLVGCSASQRGLHQ